MRGASAQSARSVLTAVDDAVEAGADPAELGDELFGVVTALDGAPALRRVLTDPSTATEAKSGLAQQVLGGKVGERTVEVVQTAVAGRWSSGRDLADALEQAGVTAQLVAAERASALDDVEDELFRFGRVVASDIDLRRAVTDRAVPAEHRRSLVERLLEGRSTQTSRALALQAVLARGRSFEQKLDEFGDLAAARRQRLIAVVTTAYELGEDEKERLAAALGRQYGRDVHVNAVVDPAVIGGISVEVGDDLIDSTVSGRLEDARRRIAG